MSSIANTAHAKNSEKMYTTDRVTHQIVAALEQGVRPWTKPWDIGQVSKPLRSNGQAYQGINVLMLWNAAIEGGYLAQTWMTYKQAKELGAQVRKGSHGSQVLFASTVNKTDTDETTGEEIEHQISFMKSYTVFNAEQIEGLPEHFYTVHSPVENPMQRLEHAELFFKAIGADIRHGGHRAFYSSAKDYIQMPDFEVFKDPEAYYSTLAHEAIHWTGPRLSRDFNSKRWGDSGYAREELVAELGSAFLAADLGLYLEPREDHASYINDWLLVLKSDKRAIFQAAAHAQRAVDYLHRCYQRTMQQAA